MKRIYQAGDLPEAYLIADLLRQDGLDVTIMNEHARGGMGDLPFTETYPEVWLVCEADWNRAQVVLDRFRSAPYTKVVFCTECREENPGTFEICWKCGANLGTGPK